LLSACFVGGIRHEYGEKTVAVGYQILPFEMALALAGALLAEREKTTQSRISGSVGRIDQHRHTVGEIETATDDETNAGGPSRFIGPHDAGKRIAVDDA